jgi:hypothetical protein
MTKTISDWVYGVQHLLTAKKSEVHTSRLQFYSDNTLNVHIQLTEQIQQDEWEFPVHIQPSDSIAADVQALVQQYPKNTHLDEAWKKKYSSLAAV